MKLKKPPRIISHFPIPINSSSQMTNQPYFPVPSNGKTKLGSHTLITFYLFVFTIFFKQFRTH
ncbi:Uncharacterised protein [Cardiobacterium hominis]|uniref:Uncharacterized protein n=1 Tax=Cardiobacterium hominis (strain ATCC 15826 / DSM 8339 / NCTC 10426 / 6573) TaxID=638300 RepID=C8NBS0_CARH6|nr:hypothetical protein HMPREF0198_1948 [Cardiobacterium hominis ATCC 15826]VEG77737.1 Uncharacterised protein [Cardiobacterium hominis]